MKKIMIISIIFLLALAGIVMADVVFTFTTNNPLNMTTLFTNTTNLNISTNGTTSLKNCTYFIDGGSESLMTNLSGNVTWNASVSVASNGFSAHNVTFKCNDTATGNITWYNSSNTTGFLYFYVNEWGNISFTDNKITNNTNYTSDRGLNITLNDSSTQCFFSIDGGSYTALSVDSGTNQTRWANNTQMPLNETLNNTFKNITYLCNDTFGNYTISSAYRYQIDRTSPTSIQNGSVIYNVNDYLNSTGDNFVGFWENITDYNPSSCWATVYFNSYSDSYKKSGTLENSLWANNNCSINFTTTEILTEGPFRIEIGANDTGNRNLTAANVTFGHRIDLKTGQWNLLGTFGNQTLLQICQDIPYCTYVSTYNNTNTTKYYTTYSSSSGTSGTNNDTAVSDGEQAVYISVSNDVTLFRLNTSTFTAPNCSITYNQSTTDTPWNICPVYTDDLHMSDICDRVPSGNISYVSYHNITDDTYYTHKCGWDINNITLPTYKAVWILSTNGTLSLGL